MKAYKINSLLASLILVTSISMANEKGVTVDKLTAEDKIENTKKEAFDKVSKSYENAADIIVIEATNNSYGSIPMDTKNSINEILTYPSFAQDEQRNDVVIVSFTYMEEGYLKVLSLNSSDEKLNPYITTKLEKIRLKKGSVTIGKEYNARFQFRLL
jgi:hypothetical protein